MQDLPVILRIRKTVQMTLGYLLVVISLALTILIITLW